MFEYSTDNQKCIKESGAGIWTQVEFKAPCFVYYSVDF